MTMRRGIASVVVLLMLAGLGHLSLVSAQDASPIASPTVLDRRLELPAMVLFPADLEEPGFGLGESGFEDATAQAEVVARETGRPLLEMVEPLRAAGFIHRYNLVLERGAPEDVATPEGVPNEVLKRIVFAVTAYTSAEGAAAGFDLLDRQWETGTGSEDIPLTTTFGQEAELTRSSSVTTDTNTPYQQLNLTFRIDNLVADVSIFDLTNQAPDPAEAEALATKLLGRIEEVRANGGPGLSFQVIRLGGRTVVDAYIVRDGQPEPMSLMTEPVLAEHRQILQGANAVYDVQQPLADGSYLVARLHQFPSPDEAAAWLEQEPNPALGPSASGYIDVTAVPDAPSLGDESRTFRYGYRLDEQTTVRGYVVFVRVGDTVARVQLDNIPEAPLAAVLELAEAQVSCLHAGECPDVIPMPAALVPTGEGPAASPVASPEA
jgi:hypothetical protein